MAPREMDIAGFSVDRPMTVTLRLPRRLALDGVFPSRSLILESILVVIKEKSSLLCFQRLSASHYDITFKQDQQDVRDSLLQSGIHIAGTHISLFESDPKSVFVSVKNLPAEVPDEKMNQVLLDFGEVLGSFHVLDDDDIWNGDRKVELIIKKDIPSLIRIGKYPAVIRYKGQKLCCHYCNRWGHAINDCPYKINHLCIRCGMGHSAKYCSHPWTLDNSPVVYEDLPVTLTQEESSVVTPVAPSAGSNFDIPFVAGKRLSEASKPKRKKSHSQKENPEAFNDVAENFTVNDLPFASDISAGPSTPVAIEAHRPVNRYSALVEEEDTNIEIDSPSLFSEPPESGSHSNPPSSSDNAPNEIPSSLLTNVTQAISKMPGLPKRLSKAALPVVPIRKPTAPKKPSTKSKTI